jgi:hypothetical protein
LGLPAIVAGQLASRIGLLRTVEGYAAVVLATAVVGLAVQASLARGDREPVGHRALRDHSRSRLSAIVEDRPQAPSVTP